MTGLSAFPLPFYASRSIGLATPRTLREVQMIQFSSHIRAKPAWYDKMNDPGIVARWTQEAVAQGMTEAQVRYVLAELPYYAALRDVRTGIEVSAVDGVWQSDTLIDDGLRSRLRDAVRVLEEVPEEEKDWHPGSGGKVLDLVHPSLFCLVREASGGPESAWQNPPKQHYWRYEFSEKFQWLPTDVDVRDDGAAVFRSYVNNVHPVTHRDLAAVLPDVFARMRPLLENVLTDLRHPRPPRIKADPYGWYDSEPKEPDESSFSDTAAYEEAYDAYEAALDDWWQDRRPVVPDAPEFTPPEPPGDARVDLRGRSLQVIVKLATIRLTPDEPEYAGGSWHVEGMLNERIVSTGIYYWDSENITESRLGFRAALDDPMYEQNDGNGLRDVYGIKDEDQLNTVLGSASTPAGRCLAFPNVLQHRVAPFRLADPTRPGHRKILVFFLVDPSERIVSTSDVPPQQPWADTSTMTLEQAREYREQLMHERKFFVNEHNEQLYEREFSLCEH